MKRISLFVLGAHIAIMLWMALWMPVTREKKKPMAIRTVVATPVMELKTVSPVHTVASQGKSETAKKPAAPPEKPAPKKSAPKKKVVKKVAPSKPAKKKPEIPLSLLNQLQESMAKIEKGTTKGSGKKRSPTSKIITGLKIDEEGGFGGSNYVGSLIDCLQSGLDLPEVGDVRVELKLGKNGSYLNMKVIRSASKRNQELIESRLPLMKFPPFSGSLQKEKEHSFVITFCNQ